MTEEPLDGLTVGFVTQLASELEDSGGANDGHPDPPASTIDLAVTVLGGRLLDGESAVAGRLLPLRINYGAIRKTVIGCVRI